MLSLTVLYEQGMYSTSYKGIDWCKVNLCACQSAECWLKLCMICTVVVAFNYEKFHL